MIKTKGMVHFTIPVTDLQRAKAFYCDLLGFGPDSQTDSLTQPNMRSSSAVALCCIVGRTWL